MTKHIQQTYQVLDEIVHVKNARGCTLVLPPISHNVLFIEKENIGEFLNTIQEYKDAQ